MGKDEPDDYLQRAQPWGWCSNRTYHSLAKGLADFAGDGVGAGVGEFVADGFIFGPRRDESPTHRL